LDKYLNIITWDAPYPANYGGVIDVLYTIENLHAAGVKIVLHCFTYNDRQASEVLDSYCEQVHYYNRDKKITHLFSLKPYIVASRMPQLLLQNLLLNNYPILFEGIHSTGFANHEKLLSRKKYFRPQNIEQQYYSQLAANSNSAEKIFFKLEAAKLKWYENNLPTFDAIISVVQHDCLFFKKLYPFTKSVYLPSFHPFAFAENNTAKQNYCLYHGNLSVQENEKSAVWLIENVFNNVSTKLIISGKNPTVVLKSLIEKFENITLIQNPDDKHLNSLIANAQINLLPSFQNTGLKLKLLHTLFLGGHCIANAQMLTGTSLDAACTICDTAPQFVNTIDELMNITYTKEQWQARKQLMAQHYIPQKNTEVLMSVLFD
jgi:hypothetical protein